MEPLIGIVMLTHNRLPMLKIALPSMLRSLTLPAEVIIVDNASTDGTGEFLKRFQARYSLPNVFSLRVDRLPENIGTAAYNHAMKDLTAPVLIEVDDDVVQFPNEWDRKLVDALIHGDRIGYVSTDVVKDDWTDGNRADGITFGTTFEQLPDGGKLEIGVVGGWCAATPRTLFQALGGFPMRGAGLFELEDGAYANLLFQYGMRFAIHTDVKVYHASGPKIAKAMGLWQTWFAKYDPEVDPAYADMRLFGEAQSGDGELPEILQIDESVNDLIHLLRQEERMLLRFVGILDRQKLLLFEHRYAEFEDSVSEQEALLVQLNRVESERKRTILKIAEALHIGHEETTLNDLISSTMGQFEEEWSEARRLLHRISERLTRIVSDSSVKTTNSVQNWKESISSLIAVRRSKARTTPVFQLPNDPDLGIAI